MPDGKVVHDGDFGVLRPVIEEIKAQWEKLISVDKRFFLEDKRWALAIHARRLPEQTTHPILAEAKQLAEGKIYQTQLQILESRQLLEVAPITASKARTVSFLLSQKHLANALAVYLGDDAHDEEAFDIIHRHHGIAIQVGKSITMQQADWQIISPRQAQSWLAGIPSYLRAN